MNNSNNSLKKTKGSKTQKALKGGESSQFVVNDDFAHIEPVQAKPLEVIVTNNNFDRAMKIFRSIVQKEKILALYKEKQNFEKKSDKKRRKHIESLRKNREFENEVDSKPKKFKVEILEHLKD